MQRNLVLTTIICLSLVTGCGIRDSNTAMYGTGGGVLGAASGAIAGTLIANGDVAMSALLGAGLGVGSGLLVGYWLDEREKMRIAEVKAAIERNERQIRENEEEIDALSKQVHSDSQREELNDDTFIHMYQGPSIGVYQ